MGMIEIRCASAASSVLVHTENIARIVAARSASDLMLQSVVYLNDGTAIESSQTLEELFILVSSESSTSEVTIPKNEEQARAMVLIGMKWLEDHGVSL